MNHIAIIPAKKYSERCPGKNLRKFNNIPLFLYSVQYAINEGITPVVSTDSEEIMNICYARGIQVVKEKVNDSSMCNCIQQVLAQIQCDSFAILQPTSPLRRQGLLSEMLKGLQDNKFQSCYTANVIKPIGHYKGKFNICYRAQDTKEKLMFFDGNINACTKDFFLKTKQLFDDNSVPFINQFPSNLQIDTESEFTAIEALAKLEEFQDLVPKFNQLKICVVTNRPQFDYDYSQFIDNCDIVVRLSKMCSLDSAKTGSKVDIVVINANPYYLQFTTQQRHVKELKSAKHVFFLHNYIKNQIVRDELNKDTTTWSTFSYTERHTPKPGKSGGYTTFMYTLLYLLNNAFPDQKMIYMLGDVDTYKRTESAQHSSSGETEDLIQLIQEGKVCNILKQDDKCYIGQIQPDRTKVLK